MSAPQPGRRPLLGREGKVLEQALGVLDELATLLKRDRRATPRVPVELELEERVEGARYFRITSDLSPFGLSTRQGFPYHLGTRMKVLLYLPDGEGTPLELDSEVVGAYAANGGLRLAFRNPELPAVRRIHRFLAARAA